MGDHKKTTWKRTNTMPIMQKPILEQKKRGTKMNKTLVYLVAYLLTGMCFGVFQFYYQPIIKQELYCDRQIEYNTVIGLAVARCHASEYPDTVVYNKGGTIVDEFGCTTLLSFLTTLILNTLLWPFMLVWYAIFLLANTMESIITPIINFLVQTKICGGN